MLIVHAAGDPQGRYSRYLAEIVRLEGFVDAAEADLATLDAATLAAHDLVLLPRLALARDQVDLLMGYVVRGGRLLACAPDPALARRCGLAPTFAAVRDGYLQVDTARPLVRGLCRDRAQVIVPTMGWRVAEGAPVEVLARVAPAGVSPFAGTPGVAWAAVGAGAAALVAYDLPHAVARLRQGDPANADLCLAGLDGVYRPSELFVGQLDPEQSGVPQADLHTALLARLIERLAPRPRLWYYPAAARRSALIMTSDDDWSTLEEFAALLAALRARRGRCTFFIIPGTNVTPTLLREWEREGHSFSAHPALPGEIRAPLDTGEAQAHSLPPLLRAAVADFRATFGREVRTIRQHAVRWLGHTAAARHLAALGVGMDCNFVSVAPFPMGYLAGSGRALRFVEADGAILPLFQQPTLWTEECLIHPSFVFSLKWGVERALAATTTLTRRAAGEFYTPVAINSHPVSFATYSRPLIEGTWDHALAEGLPIISADEWLAWTAARDATRLDREGDAWHLRPGAALPEVTILYPPGVTPAADGAALSEQTLWGQTYRAATLTGLAAGERRRVG